jgi:[protein-PII] uridylyltransferase
MLSLDLTQKEIISPSLPPAPPKKKLVLITKDEIEEALAQTDYQQEKLIEVVRDRRKLILERAEHNLSQGFYQGAACATQTAQATDILIIALFTSLSQHILGRAKKPDKLMLVAVGGYGTGHLAPFSDIDLLFVLPRTRNNNKIKLREKLIELMLKILWDSGFKLGQSVRDIKNIIKCAKEDMVFCTSLLDARLLSGEEALFEVLQKQFERAKKTIKPRRFVKAKLIERDARHEKEGRSRFLVEPNIKNSKGGLRDLQTLWWLVKFCYGKEADIFSQADNKKLLHCEGFLWAARCHLHFLCGHGQEQLSFQHQQALAERQGARPNDNQAVEKFMKNYFLVAKEAGNLTRILCAQLENEQAKPQPKISALIKSIRKNKNEKYIKLARRFVVEGGRLKAEDEKCFIDKPINMLRYFELAAEHNLNFHPLALNQIKDALRFAPKNLRKSPIANRTFLHILTARKNPARVLRAMNETGLLGWFVPAFGKIVAQMQFNMYHHYTVDEHLLHAIEQVSILEHAELEGIKNARKVATTLARQKPLREVLYLALFTHDISKGQKGDHSSLGAETCLKLAKRFGLEPDRAALAAWLVENHLLLSDVAQKRDLSERKTIRNFAQAVKTPERLNLLFLLTIADINAVGPGTWNGWKAELINTLYQLTLAEIKESSSMQSARRQRRELAAQLDWNEKHKRAYLKEHGDSYWQSTKPELQKTHATLWNQWKEKTPFAFAAKNLPHQDVSEIVIITQDHPGLFSRIVGGIAISELLIIDAKIFTTHNGLAFDSFWIQAQHQKPIGPNHAQRLKENIEKVLGGELLPHKEIDKQQALHAPAQAVFDIAPQIEFDNGASDSHSVIEVECLNSPYLLHSLSRKIFHEGLALSSAQIATFGERAVDVFYVQDAFAQKIVAPEKQAHLKKELLKVITSTSLSPR